MASKDAQRRSEGAVFDGRTEEPQKTDPRLLEILVCPLTRSTLEYDKNRQELVSRKARLAFPIRDGVPIMLVDEAHKLDS